MYLILVYILCIVCRVFIMYMCVYFSHLYYVCVYMMCML